MSLNVNQLAKPLKITKRIQETADAVSLVLAIPADLKSQYRYQAGQFVSFFLNVNGEAFTRSYSLSTSPLVDTEFKITVKKVPGGRGSTYLCERVKEGDTLMTTPPAGHFFKPSLEPKGVYYFLIAAGSGITPVYSIMKTVLSASTLNHVTLVYCNRNEDSIIYRREIDDWAKTYPSRLDVIHTLTKPSSSWTGRCGRVDRAFIGELVDLPSSGPSVREYYLCGPKDFMSTVRGALTENGVAKDQIREEDFGVGVHSKPATDSKPAIETKAHWTFIGKDAPAERPETIIAKINGETVEVPAKEGQSVLESLLEAGAQPPYSCMDGACMACLGRVQDGRVYQEDPGILTDDNIAAYEALTCQAKPLSRIVKVSYDDL